MTMELEMGGHGGCQQEVTEEGILRAFFAGRSSVDGVAHLDTIISYKYSIYKPKERWADGLLFSYSNWINKWSPSGMRVKFYFPGNVSRLSDMRKPFFKKVDEMKRLPSFSNVVTPLFAIYVAAIEQIVVCYPYFSMKVSDWLPTVQVSTPQHTLPPIWIDFIRGVLPFVAFAKMEEIENDCCYVWSGDKINIILLPEEGEGENRSYPSRLAVFLRSCLNNHNNGDLDSFIIMLESLKVDTTLKDITEHPLLQDLDSLSVLIRTTWRPILSQSQINTLNATIIPTKWGRNHSWQVLPINDLVLEVDMLAAHPWGNDANGLFTFVKEVAAHYPEKYRKRHGCLLVPHPVSKIKLCFPGLVSDIYKLSLNEAWLKK